MASQGVGELAHRVLPSVSGSTGSGGFMFGLTQDGSPAPVTYDPCRSVHFVVNVASAPPGSLALVQSAVRRISAATGLQFVDDGLTDEPAGGERESFQPERYGGRWAPVLVAWSNPKDTPELAGDVLGSAGSDPRRDSRGQLSYVTGDVTLDAPELSELMANDGGDTSAFTLILHELGHVVGLDHSPDVSQVMYFETDGQTQFGQGDLRGLARVGRGECAPHL